MTTAKLITADELLMMPGDDYHYELVRRVLTEPLPPHFDVTRHRPGQQPEVLGEDDILDGGDLLPGFSVPVWQLFRRHR